MGEGKPMVKCCQILLTSEVFVSKVFLLSLF